MQQRDASQDQHNKNSKDKTQKQEKDKTKLKAGKQSDKQHSDLSNKTPFTVFKAFGNHASRIFEILKNESLLQEQKRYFIKHFLEN